jgi:pimeloyl-ACP methyl ester carboxylesterase
MPIDTINGVRIFWEQTGERGAPLVLVHGSWGDHHNWDAVVPALARTFRVFTYDRRGHSQSERCCPKATRVRRSSGSS